MPIITPYYPIPPGATLEQRKALMRKYASDVVRFNPDAFLPHGVRKRWWHLFKIEHPTVLLADDNGNGNG